MNWKQIIGGVAPTVLSALTGPLSAMAVTAIGGMLGIDEPTQEKIQQEIEGGNLRPEHVVELKKLEMQYREEEKNRGFKYAELEFRDRDSARNANVSGGTQEKLFWLSCFLLVISIGSEVAIMFRGLPAAAPEMVIGRVLGLLDATTMMVLGYWYGQSYRLQQSAQQQDKR